MSEKKAEKRGYLVTFIEDALINRNRKSGDNLLQPGIYEALTKVTENGFGLIGVSRFYSIPLVPLERAKIDHLFDWVPCLNDLEMHSVQPKLVRSACFKYGLGVRQVAVGIGNLSQRRDATVGSRGIINLWGINPNELPSIMDTLFPKT